MQNSWGGDILGLIVLIFNTLISFTALNSLIKKLDNRIKQNEVKRAKRTGFPCQKRQISNFNSRKPPKEGPSWEIHGSCVPTCMSLIIVM